MKTLFQRIFHSHRLKVSKPLSSLLTRTSLWLVLLDDHVIDETLSIHPCQLIYWFAKCLHLLRIQRGLGCWSFDARKQLVGRSQPLSLNNCSSYWQVLCEDSSLNRGTLLLLIFGSLPPFGLQIAQFLHSFSYRVLRLCWDECSPNLLFLIWLAFMIASCLHTQSTLSLPLWEVCHIMFTLLFLFLQWDHFL